ncbi:MAG: DUF6683 family protein [Fimbriimonadaceae bacterium]
MQFRFAAYLCFALISCVSLAQVPSKNPLVDRAESFGRVGLTAASTDGASPLKFKPTGKRVYLDEYVKVFADDEASRKTLSEFFEQALTGVEEAAKESKSENDGAFAYAFSVLLLDQILTEKEFDEKDYLSVAGQMRQAFAGVKATDLQKQEFYEWSVYSAMSVIAMGSALEGEEGAAKLKTLAEANLAFLTGAKIGQLSFVDGHLLIKGVGGEVVEKPVESSGGLAAGFSYSLPEGWTEADGWIQRVDPYFETNRIGAHIRMLPAVKASGDLGATIRQLWTTYLPAELQGKSSGMVFRRYLGDGLPAFFIFGQGQVKGEQADSLYSLYLVDCGTYWQPFVLAQTWKDPTVEFPVGTEYSAPLSYGKSADIAEVFFRGIRCPSSKGRALVDKSAVVGDYSFGSGSSLQWENIYTGASAMTFVSYGGTLNFASNGTFTYTYSSASGIAGAANFRGAKGSGSWKIEGDILTCQWKTYDQGDGYRPKDYVYRVAGVISYTDGSKVLVLKQNLELPINAVTVRDSSDYYTTKKK